MLFKKTGFHQFQIHKQSSRPALSVHERVYFLEFNMKLYKPRDDILCAVPIRLK